MATAVTTPETTFRTMVWTGGASDRGTPCATCQADIRPGHGCVVETTELSMQALYNWDLYRVFCPKCGLEAAASVGKTPALRPPVEAT